MKIFKYRIERQLEIPGGGKIVHVDVQDGAVTLWAEVDEEARTVTRRFRVIGTGWEFNPTGMVHLATVMNGNAVWHIYEEVAQ